MSTADNIKEITDAIKDLLLYKNKKYGDSALKPINVFYQGNHSDALMIRIDDKISRIKNRKDYSPETNDICDIIGYCVLLLINKCVTAEEINKLKDWLWELLPDLKIMKQ